MLKPGSEVWLKGTVHQAYPGTRGEPDDGPDWYEVAIPVNEEDCDMVGPEARFVFTEPEAVAQARTWRKERLDVLLDLEHQAEVMCACPGYPEALRYAIDRIAAGRHEADPDLYPESMLGEMGEENTDA